MTAVSHPLSATQLALVRLAYEKHGAAMGRANAELHADLAPLYADLGIDASTKYRVAATPGEPACLIVEPDA